MRSKPSPYFKDIPIEKIFKAMGHRARIDLVREVGRGERKVGDLVELTGLAWSTVSGHLSVLKEAGILEEEKRGLEVFYRLKLKPAANFIRYMEDKTFRARADQFLKEMS